jgi:PAS domain S-box-containing protein
LDLSITYAAISFLTAASLTVLLVSCLSRQSARGKGAFLIVMIGMIMWTVLKGLEVLEGDPDSKLTFLKLQYSAIALLSPTILVFVIQYTGLYRDPRWTDIGLLIALPVIDIGLVATNGYHHLFWSDVGIETGQIEHLTFAPGPFFYVHTAYSYLLVLISLVILMLLAFRDARHRVQSILLIMAIGTPVVGGVVFDAIVGISEIDLTPLLFAFSAMVIAIAVYRFDILSSQPMTRDIVFDNIEDPIIILDSKGSVTDMNNAAEVLTGHNKKEASNIPLLDLLPIRADSIRDLLSGRSRTIEMKDSRGRRILIQSFIMGRDARLVMVRDITKLKEAEIVLKRSHEELENLVNRRTSELKATADILREEARERKLAEQRSCEEASRSALLLDLMGHDIGNLNQAIYGRVQMMKAREEDHVWLKKNIGELDESMRRALQLVENIRTMSQIERTSPEPRPINVSAMVRKCSQMAVDAFPGRAVTVHSEGVRDNVFVLGEPVLERAIFNIVHNAIKAQKNNPEIWLGVRSETDRAIITVADAGGGINPSNRSSLLERKKRGGDISLSGVGLMFSRTAIERLGGSIRIDDRVEGEWTKGAKFSIELPLHK